MIKRNSRTISCLYCGGKFMAKAVNQRYCSLQCARNFKREKYFNDHPRKPAKHWSIKKREEYKKITNGLPPATSGAISELIACADLLHKGYYVFRTISANSPYDIIATKNGTILKIEVRTGTVLKNGKISVNKHTNHENDLADHWAIYRRETKQIVYEPLIEANP